MIVNKGFKRKRPDNNKLPPGQYETKDFPVLSLGPTPVVTKDDWGLKIFGLVETELNYNWAEFNKLLSEQVTKDIHCVTKWSKFETHWTGVSLDKLMELAKVKPEAKFIIAYSYDGYTTNLPIADIKNGQAWVAIKYENEDIPSEHGGPARLLVPHLYFWKSAKWLRAIEFVESDQPGFWETRGYHNYGDPWKEERYSFDE